MNPSRLRILIVDAEPLARERLETLLAADPDVEVTAVAADVAGAVLAIERTAPDLVFLDIQMPGGNAFDVISAVGSERMPAVIFVTASDRYALRAFEVRALDYLLKPFDRERFLEALDRAKRRIVSAPHELASRLGALIADVRGAKKPLDRLVVKSGGRVFFIKCDDIDWIEAAGNYVQLHVGSATHMLRETMSALEERLDPDRFFRIHRSHIVNIDRVRELQPGVHGEYVVRLTNGVELTLTRGYRERLQEKLGKGF